MAATTPKITLSASRDIPFNRLVLSQANVRRVKAGVSIEQLAEDIARRTLLHSLSVRPVLDGDGQETGTYEVPAGGRRYRALELLVRQKRLAKTAPVPCVVRTEGLAEEDSLAENTQREALHPLDQFRAFATLRERGLGDEEIAARFFVTPAVVRQRLKLASASPRLLDLYAEDQLTLEQLMAFCVTDDHARQERVWEALGHSYTREPYAIRRLLTEGAVRGGDKRAQFVGTEAYEAAGGVVMRDLFQQDEGGWFQDAGLLDRLAREKLMQAAEALRADEGWKWVEAAPDFPYGHTYGLRRIAATEARIGEEEQAELDALRAEYDALVEEHEGGDGDLPEAVDARLIEIEETLARFEARPPAFDPHEVARAGAFVSLDPSGVPRVERGYVRPEDEPPPVAVPDAPGTERGHPGDDDDVGVDPDTGTVQHAVVTVGGGGEPQPAEAPDEEDGLKPLPERLLTELTAHRTLALRAALADDPHAAFLAVLHALCFKAFYGGYGSETCLEIEAKSLPLGGHAPGLNDTASARALEERHAAWLASLPRDAGQLWDWLGALDNDSRSDLFALTASRAVNAVHLPWDRRPRALAHADRLAQAAGLDMAAPAVGWTPTVDNYLGRVTKARILAAVREAKGEQAAQLIDHLRKADMASEAERLLAGTGWLPEVLRTPGLPGGEVNAPAAADTAEPEQPEAASLPAFLTRSDPDGAGPETEPVEAAEAIAAE
jgi:ParB family chromosome partitioning protein